MIDALISGRVTKAATQGMGAKAEYVKLTIAVTTREAQTLYANCIAFNRDHFGALIALEAGDAIALSGELTPQVWTPEKGAPRVSLSFTIHGLLSAYNLSRKREAFARNDRNGTTKTHTPKPAKRPPRARSAIGVGSPPVASQLDAAARLHMNALAGELRSDLPWAT